MTAKENTLNHGARTNAGEQPVNVTSAGERLDKVALGVKDIGIDFKHRIGS